MLAPWLPPTPAPAPRAPDPEKSSAARVRARSARAACGAVLLWVAVSPLGGCVMYAGNRTPNLVATTEAPQLPAPLPQINLVLRHTHTLDASRTGPTATDLSYDEFVSSLGRVRARTPFLAESGEGIPEPDYVLDLDTEIAERGKTSAFISGLTLLIVPGFSSSDAVCRATLKTPEGKRLAKFEAVGEMKIVWQILLLPLAPFALAAAQADDFYDDTLEDIMIQLGMYLERNPVPPREPQP